MAFFTSAIDILKVLVIALGAGIGACGALSTCLRATATTTLTRMLVYGKEASNRKQEIDRQHHKRKERQQKE